MEMMTYKSALAAQLRAEMAARRVGSEELARRADLGVTTIANARAGRASSDTYRALTKALGVSWTEWVRKAEEVAG